MIQQIYLTGFLNAILKVFMTYLVLQILSEADGEVFSVSWKVAVIRVVTCILLHSANIPSVSRGLKFLKITILNLDEFERPFNAVIFALCKFLSDVLLEAAQIWKVLTLTNYMDILFAAAAFKFLQKFQSFMLLPLLDEEMKAFDRLTFTVAYSSRSEIVI